jgi:hypothetical protein
MIDYSPPKALAENKGEGKQNGSPLLLTTGISRILPSLAYAAKTGDLIVLRRLS